MVPLPAHDLSKQFLHRTLVADEVIVDDECRAQSLGYETVEFGSDLTRGLEARTAAKHDDDVAEFAGEGASSRELDTAVGVSAAPEEVEPRRRYPRHVGRLRLFVAALMAPFPPFPEEARPCLLGLPHEDDLGEVTEIVLLHSDPRAADDCEDAALLQLLQDLAHTPALHVHPGDADQVGAGATVEVDLFDVLVDQLHVVPGGGEGGKQRKARRREDRLDVKKGQGVLQTPIRDVETRVYQDDVRHLPLSTHVGPAIISREQRCVVWSRGSPLISTTL